MKKVLAIALVGIIAISTQAAKIDWSTVALTFDGASLKNNTSVSGYLIALEASSLDASYELTEAFDISTIGTVVASRDGTPKSAKLTGTTDISEYSNGDSFAFLVTYNDGTDTYYNLSSSVFVLSGLDPNDPSVAPTEWDMFAVTDATSATAGTLTAGGGWTKAATAVPEPASAMLALAGVAMLIRRRK